MMLPIVDPSVPAGSVEVAATALGVDGPLDLQVSSVPVEHGPIRPPHQPHKVPLSPATIEPVVGERVPELMRMNVRVVPGLIGPPLQHLIQLASRRHAPRRPS